MCQSPHLQFISTRHDVVQTLAAMEAPAAIAHLLGDRKTAKMSKPTVHFEEKLQISVIRPRIHQSSRPVCHLFALPHELLAYICIFLDLTDLTTFLRSTPLFDSWINRGAAQQIAKLKERERFALERRLIHSWTLWDGQSPELRHFRAHYIAIHLLHGHERAMRSQEDRRPEKVKSNYSIRLYRHLVPVEPFPSDVPCLYSIFEERPMYEWVKQAETTPLGKLRLFEHIEQNISQLTRQVRRFLSCRCLCMNEAAVSFPLIYDGLMQILGFFWLQNRYDPTYKQGYCIFVPRTKRLEWLSTQPEGSRKNMKSLLENLSNAFGQLGGFSSVIKGTIIRGLSETLQKEYDRFIRSRHQYWFVGLLLFDDDSENTLIPGLMRLSVWISGETRRSKLIPAKATNVEVQLQRRWRRWRARGKAYLQWSRQASVELDRPATYDDFVAAGDFPRQDGWEKQGRRIFLALEGISLS